MYVYVRLHMHVNMCMCTVYVCVHVVINNSYTNMNVAMQVKYCIGNFSILTAIIMRMCVCMCMFVPACV